MKKRLKNILIFLLIVMYSCNGGGIEGKIYKEVERSFNEMMKLQAEKIREYNISKEELKEAKSTIYQINLLIWKDNVQKFIKMLDNIVYYNILEEDEEKYTKERLISEEYFAFFKRLFFSGDLLRREGLKGPYSNNYRYQLREVLRGNKLYKMKIEIKRDKEEGRYIIFCYTCRLGKYSECTGFGIGKRGGEWKIVALYMD